VVSNTAESTSLCSRYDLIAHLVSVCFGRAKSFW
jgi:hypothetical protein